MKCEYCAREFTRHADLKRHQRQAKYCLRKRGLIKDDIVVYACPTCDLKFMRKDSLTRHTNLNTCKPSETQNRYLMDQISQLQKQITELMKSKTPSNNNRVVVNNLPPITDQDLEENIEKLSIEFILEGAKGYADFATSYPFKDRVVCTDKSRKKIKYKDATGEVIDDPYGRKLTQKFFTALAERNKELIGTEYRVLQQRVQEIAENGDAGDADLAGILTKSTRFS